MKSMKYFISLFIAFLIVSCASTKMTSFKDPDYQKAEFKRILIVANTNDLEDRQKLESKMVEEFSNIGVFALESFRLFPPTRELTDEDKVELLLKNDIDAFISISVGESGVDEVYVPQTSSTTKTKGEVNVYGNTARYKEKSTTTYQGGYTLDKPWAEFDTKLYDVSNGRNVWLASSFTGGNALANFNTVINSYCQEVVQKLEEEKLILSKNIVDTKITEQKRLEEEKKQVEINEQIKKNKSESRPPKQSLIYLKDNTTVKGLILSSEKDNEIITRITLKKENGDIVTIYYQDIDRIEEIN